MMLSLFLLLALANGVMVSLSRSFNGALAANKGALQASLLNHLLGFLLLTLVLAVYTRFQGGAVWQLQATPAYTWLGGVIGALFVATSSWALARLGAMACALLVISGQMLTGVWLDSLSRELGWQAWLGAALILAGVILQRLAAKAQTRRVGSGLDAADVKA
ncbi:DMT family transporter [Shewanella algae]|uniref:DMT family transporter n=1 Tax=Shewanella algae TaxID=38313 RepID=UPI0021B34C55|nr:DMT family transporter [Shewanella algae]MDL2194781.1 DMT family transporter [Shewanella algae]